MADGTSIATTELKIEFVSEDADYNSVLGWYNKRTGEAGFLFASTNDDGKNATVHAGDITTLSVLQSDLDSGDIGFFLVPDGTKDVARLGDTQIRFELDRSGNGEIVYDTKHGEKELLGTQGQILFSDSTLNVGDKDYMSGQVGTAGQTTAQKFGNQSDGDDGILGLMAWDDQVIKSGNKGTDRDFNDVVFNISVVNHVPTVSGDTSAVIDADGIDVTGTTLFIDPDPFETGAVAESHLSTYGTWGISEDGSWFYFRVKDLSYLHEGENLQDSFTIHSIDGSASQEITIEILGVNDAPTKVQLGNTNVDEETAGAIIGTVQTIDPDSDSGFTYKVSDDRFEIVIDDTLGPVLKLKDGVSLDYETTGPFHEAKFTIDVTDQGGATHTEFVFIAINDVVEAAQSGIAIDGYLAGATVFADKDGDLLLDADEQFTLTDAKGNFTLDASDFPLVLRGTGFDQALGMQFDGVLTAPAGSTVITPLTTLIATVAGDSMPLEDAIGLVRQALGLPDSLDPLNTDPIAAYVGGDQDALSLFAMGAELINTASLIGSMFEGAYGIPPKITMPAVFAAIADRILTDNPIDFTSADSIVGLMTITGNNLGVPLPDVGIVEESAGIVAAANAYVETNAADPNLPPNDLLTQISAGSLIAQGAAGDAVQEFALTGIEPDDFFNFLFDYPSQANGNAYLINDPSGSTTYGDDGANTPTLTEDDDSYDGKGGEDVIAGLGGNDTLSGGADKDTLDGGEGDDRLDGGFGDDLIDGGNGNDTVSYASADSERVVSLLNGAATPLFGTEYDTISNVENVIGSGYIDFITGDGNANILEGRASNDVLHGLGGNDVLIGGAAEDQLYGEGGIDEIRHSGTAVDGSDVLYDADGTDYIVLTTPDLYDINFSREGDDLFIGGFELDQVDSGSVQVVGHYAGSSIAYVIFDTEFYNELYSGTTDYAKLYFTTDIANGLVNQQDGGEILLGGDADEIINTNGGIYDSVYAGLGNDIINGGDEKEQLRGNGGDDEIHGGGGNDRLSGNEGFDTLDGGDGNDLARYDRASGGVIVDLAAGTADDRDSVGNIDHDTLISVESVRGSEFADILLGDSGANFIDAIGGNDTINAGTGDNTISGGAGDDTVEDGGGNDLVDGGSGDDRLETDGVGDWLTGGDGIDIVALTKTPPTSDTLSTFADFTLGTDRIDISEIIAAFTNASDPTLYVQVANVTDDDGAHTIIQVSPDGTGSGFVDVLRLLNVTVSLDDLLNNGAFLLAPETGTDGPDDVTLTDFGDIFDGSGGNDTIAALGGDDKITGGAEDDEVDLGSGSDTYYHTGALSDGNDTIHAGDDGLDGVIFTGSNFYDIDFTRDGNDLVVAPFDAATQADLGSVRVADHYAGASVAFVRIDFEFYNLDYGTDPDVATFYFTPDLANGIENPDAAEILLGSIAGETINGNGGFYDGIFGFGGDDTIDGGDGLDNIRGGEGNDTVFAGGGNDSVRGDQGDDYLDGGDGTDNIRYDRGVVLSGVMVDLSLGIGKDRDSIDDAVGTDTLVNFENIRGSAFDDELTGNDGDNIVLARGGDDMVFGLGGANTLLGEGGNDYLQTDGSFGFLSGGAGDDVLAANGAEVQLDGGEGDDLLLQFGAIAQMSGGSGRDVFRFSTYDVDNFSYVFDFELGQTGDILDVTHLGPIDPATVADHFAIFDFEADAFLMFNPDGFGDNFIPIADLTSMAGVTLQQLMDDGQFVFEQTFSTFGLSADESTTFTGLPNGIYAMAGNDTVDGAGGNDYLNGGAGDDLLIGGSGNDQLEGGPGSDTLVFGLAGAGNDIVWNFDRTSDKLSFSDVVDADFDGLDLDDLLAMVASTLDDGSNVLVTYTTGATTQFHGVGNGGIGSLTDLVDDPGGQISVA